MACASPASSELSNPNYTVLPTCASFSASLICVAVVELLAELLTELLAELLAVPAAVALLDVLPEELSPATFDAVSQAVKRKATAQIARSR